MEVLWVVMLGLGVVSSVTLILVLWSRLWPSRSAYLEDLRIQEFSINGRHYYKPVIWYCFTVNGERFCSGCYSFMGGRSYSSKSSAESSIRFLGESELEVHYCPLWPKLSYVCIDQRLIIGLAIISVLALTLPSVRLFIL